MTSRSFCFTINDDIGVLAFFGTEGFDATKVRYVVWQFENCPTTLRQHIQGYIELKQPMRVKAVKKLLGFEAHLEKRKGTRGQARNYCMKPETRAEDGGPHEWGEWQTGGQGERNDLTQLYSEIKAGAALSTLLESNPGQFIRFHRGIQFAKFVVANSNSRTSRLGLSVSVFWGASGAGKTRRAYELSGGSLFSLTKGNNSAVWFDGYEGEGTLLIDDFYGWIPYGYLLQILDVYPLRLEVKGGHTFAQWNRVIITSNSSPSEWYHRENQQSLDRRIHNICRFDPDGTITPERGQEPQAQESLRREEGSGEEETV